MNSLSYKLKQLCTDWMDRGLPSRQQIIAQAVSLDQWKQKNAIAGLWDTPVKLLSTTLDDGIGQGIEIINLFSATMGIQVVFLGLVQSPEAIVSACRKILPDILGMTVLQQDSEDGLHLVGRSLPPKTRLIAGGAAFKYDPELAERCSVDYVAENVAYFIDYVLRMYCIPNSGKDGSEF